MNRYIYRIIAAISLTILMSFIAQADMATFSIPCTVNSIDSANNTITLTQDLTADNGESIHRSVTYDLYNKNLILGISKGQKVIVSFIDESTYQPKITAILPEN